LGMTVFADRGLARKADHQGKQGTHQESPSAAGTPVPSIVSCFRIAEPVTGRGRRRQSLRTGEPAPRSALCPRCGAVHTIGASLCAPQATPAAMRSAPLVRRSTRVATTPTARTPRSEPADSTNADQTCPPWYAMPGSWTQAGSATIWYGDARNRGKSEQCSHTLATSKMLGIRVAQTSAGSIRLDGFVLQSSSSNSC
jgi:hypothetical protein